MLLVILLCCNNMVPVLFFYSYILIKIYALSIELLLQWKANVRAVDSSKNTSLHLACQRRHSSAASLLLNWIDSISSENSFQSILERTAVINMTNRQQRTPLHLAARNGLVTVS